MQDVHSIAAAVRFPSPYGELHFSIKAGEIEEMNYYMVSVPLRGTTFLNRKLLKFFRTLRKMVSVPLRGTTFLNAQRNTEWWCLKVSVPLRGTTFLNQTSIYFRQNTSQFPSPYGELHFSICRGHSHQLPAFSFPSPSGELHFSIHVGIILLASTASFRPLTGNYISQFRALDWPWNMVRVSVPLRGTTFLNFGLKLYTVVEYPFPSPYGELHFSIV